jgi:hypothetical protein
MLTLSKITCPDCYHPDAEIGDDNVITCDWCPTLLYFKFYDKERRATNLSKCPECGCTHKWRSENLLSCMSKASAARLDFPLKYDKMCAYTNSLKEKYERTVAKLKELRNNV